MNNHFTASFSERGVTIYTEDKLSSFERTDLKITAKENKGVYICGDFNIDLLKTESINSNQEYYNLLCTVDMGSYLK